jgi:hypothetical protein
MTGKQATQNIKSDRVFGQTKNLSRDPRLGTTHRCGFSMCNDDFLQSLTTFGVPMPNGSPEFHLRDRPELEMFFRPIADVLAGFARRHNLILEKYYHEAPSWTCSFRHPDGGIARIEIRRETNKTVALVCCWWYDDYERLTRFLKKLKGEPKLLDPRMLSSELEISLKLILSWRFGAWDEQYSGYDSWKNTWTKQQFDALSELYPTPTI